MASLIFKENSFGFFAEFDLEDMRATFRTQVGTPKACCVHAQQAIEKLLKHLRKEQGCKPGHPDLTGHHLLRLAEATGYPNKDKYRTELLSLSKMYFEGRYPNDSEYYLFVMPTWQEVKVAVDVAEDVYTWVVSQLTAQISGEQSKLTSRKTISNMDLFR